MEIMSSRITDLDLAKLFLERNEKGRVISALFDYFEFDCLERCNVNPKDMDSKIKAFESAGCDDSAILAEIIGLIKNGKNVPDKKEEAFVQKIKDYITGHLTEDITVEEIAEKLYISYYYMCHFFKSKTGISVNAYRNRKRMEIAIRALLSTDKK